MKQFLFFILAFIAACFLFACEKVISVNIDEADKKLVIEGTVSNNDTIYPQVKISQTKNFEDDNSFNGISGAAVIIQVNDTTYTLPETSTGIYQTNAFKGIPGNTYSLSVLLNGITYTAVSTMPSQIILLDSITVEDLSFAGTTTKTIYPNYKDPLGFGNSYRLIEYVNGVQVKKAFPQNDDFSDGLVVTRPLINADGEIESGDTVRVDLQCIDKAIYKYWFSLDQSATGESQSATPTNPVTNIVGGALGYFSAYSVTSRELIVP